MKYNIYMDDIHQMVGDILTLIEKKCKLEDDDYHNLADSLEDVLVCHFDYPDYRDQINNDIVWH